MDWTDLFACFLEAKRMFPDPRSRQAACVSQNVYGLYEEVLMAALRIEDLSKRLHKQFKAKVWIEHIHFHSHFHYYPTQWKIRESSLFLSYWCSVLWQQWSCLWLCWQSLWAQKLRGVHISFWFWLMIWVQVLSTDAPIRKNQNIFNHRIQWCFLAQWWDSHTQYGKACQRRNNSGECIHAAHLHTLPGSFDD